MRVTMRTPSRVVVLLAALVEGCGGHAAGVTGPADGSADALDATSGSDAFQAPAPSDAGALPDALPPTSTCNDTTCVEGCCTGDGVCVSPPTVAACGFAGGACTTCPAGDSCNGTCLRPQPDCGPTNCAGCCQGSDQCATGTGDVSCGRGGEACQRCVPQELAGACVPEPGGGGQCGGAGDCHYPDCHGCCLPSFCAAGLAELECGSNGETCQACAAGQQCAPSALSGGICVDAGTCGPDTCAGCCMGDVCAYGNQNGVCGTGGSVCADCATYGWTCTAGTCG
jgi:hypothetical protein